MLETLRVSSLSGSSILIMLDKIVVVEEASDGGATLIHFINGKVIQCTDDIETIRDAIRRISFSRSS